MISKVFNIINVAKEDDRNNFHLFSEKYFRVEIKKLSEGDILKKFKLDDNNLFIFIIDGKIEINIDGRVNVVNTNFQIIITEKEKFSIKVIENSILEFIWSPGLYGK